MPITMEAYAKINWSLSILATREDGYHELDMLMQRTSLSDTIRFENARWTTLTVNGHPLPVDSRNLVIRAAQALCDYVGKRRSARISMVKRIPVRAGLGGGSADCAAALVALNKLWNLRLPMTTLCGIGKSLGADVPFCLTGGFQRVRGIGEKFEAAGTAREYPLLISHVGHGLSTAAVFGAYDSDPDKTEFDGADRAADTDRLAEAISLGDFEKMRAFSHNSLEKPAITLMPEIGKRIEDMYALGAVYARMTGSGSAVFGVFRTEEEAKLAQEKIPKSMLCRTLAEEPAR